MMIYAEHLTLIVKLNLMVTSMLGSCLCDYSDAYILVSGTKAVEALVAGRKNGAQAAFKNLLHLLIAKVK